MPVVQQAEFTAEFFYSSSNITVHSARADGGVGGVLGPGVVPHAQTLRQVVFKDGVGT